MKNKKIVSLLLAACLSIGAMSVNVWAENGNEQKEETPAPVVQEVEGENKEDQETKPEETKPEETKPEETKPDETEKPEETKPEETKPEETKPDETKPDETEKPADPPVAATYGTVETASERGLELHKTYTIQMVDKDGKPITNTTFDVRRPGGVSLWPNESASSSDDNGWLDLKVWKPITTADNDFYLKAPDGTWYWVELEIGGTGYDLYRHPDNSEFAPWFTARDKFEKVTLKPTPDPKPEPTPAESTVTVVKHIEGLSDKPLTNEDLAKIMEQLEGNPLTISFNNEEFKASDVTRTADGWKWERPFEGTVIERNVKETGGEVEGYDIASCSVVVQEETTTSTTVTVTNHYTKKEVTPTGTFTITKVDADNHDLKLEGAEFTLKKDGYVQTRTSDQGIAAFYNVPVGIYTLTETVAPQGYVKPNEIYTVKVNENGKISVWKVTAPSGGDFTVTLPDDFINQNPDGNVVVKDKNFVVENTKEAPGTTSYTFMKHGVVTTVDSNGRTIRTTESPLAGAEFTLYDAEENMLQTVRSAADGSVTFSNLKEGGYVIRETKAPAGYTGWNGRIKLSVHFDEQGKPEIRVLVEYLSEDREENITGELTVRNYTTVKETEHPVDDRPSRPTYRDDDDDDFVLPTVTRKDNNKKPANKPANKPERAPKVEEVVPSKRNPETGSSSSMPIAMAAAAVSLTGLVVLCKKKDK